MRQAWEMADVYLIGDILMFLSCGMPLGVHNPERSSLAAAPSQRRFALARIIVCCGTSIVAHFARKVRATNP